MAAEFPPSPFWDFSLALYAKPGVAPACLGLQERHGADVNFLMFCLWHAAAGRGRIDDAAMTRTTGAVAEWHSAVVVGLRAVRKRLKTPIGTADAALAQALRARLQKIEIDAEHIEQLMLAATATQADGPPSLTDGAANLARYYARFGAPPGETDLKDMAIILAQAFGVDDFAAATALDAALP